MDTRLQHDPTKITYSCSSCNLTQTEIFLLFKCLNISLPLKKLKLETHLLPVELLHRYLITDKKKDQDAILHLKRKTKS